MRNALLDESKVALAQAVIGTEEHVTVILATGERLVLELLFYLEEIKLAPRAFAQVQTVEAELEMAKTLIQNMAGSFEPDLVCTVSYMQGTSSSLRQPGV